MSKEALLKKLEAGEETENDMITMSKKEMRAWFGILIEEIPIHEMSEATKEKLQRHNNRIENIEKAIFGDKSDPTDLGMKEMIKQVHRVFTGTRFATRGIIYIFGGIGVCVGGFYALMRLFKDIAN